MNKITSPVKALLLMALLFMGATMARAEVCVGKRLTTKTNTYLGHIICIQRYQYLKYDFKLTQMFEKADGYSRADPDTSVPIRCRCK